MDLKQYAISLENRHIVLAQRLVESGRVPIRAQIKDPKTQKEIPALFFTIKSHYDEMFDYLLGKGHEESGISQDKDGNTAIMIAIESNNEYALYQYLSLYPNAALVRNNRGESALALAARHGRTRIVQLLIHLGADVNSVDAEGSTPLHAAAAYGHLEVITMLIESGCKFSVTNKKGFTPLDYAYSVQTAYHLQSDARQHFDRAKEHHKRLLKQKRLHRSMPSLKREE